MRRCWDGQDVPSTHYEKYRVAEDEGWSHDWHYYERKKVYDRDEVYDEKEIAYENEDGKESVSFPDFGRKSFSENKILKDEHCQEDAEDCKHNVE